MTQPQVRDGIAGARVADELREAILRGAHPPGTRLRQEELAAQYGASRVPVREALRILEAEGLVTTVANTGAWIARLSLDECVELYQVRERIEPLLLRYSLPHLTPVLNSCIGFNIFFCYFLYFVSGKRCRLIRNNR